MAEHDRIAKNATALPVASASQRDGSNSGAHHPSRDCQATSGHGVAFQTWQSLAHEGLTDSEAAQLIIGLITAAEPDG
jgi:hypothetical protein